MAAGGSRPPGGSLQASPVRLGEAGGRWVLLVTVLGSGMAMLDATVVNVALPAIGTNLDAGLTGLQWVVNAYTLTLAALILLGGSLGDRYGRKRVFMVGVVWFALASLGCALAPSIEALIATRALQGIGGALLTPGSLAIIQASFAAEDRARAVGAWSGLTGIAAAAGPLVGGWLVAAGSWRWIFLLNLPLAVVVLLVGYYRVPESSAPSQCRHLDIAGAALCTVGLAGVTYSLTTAGAPIIGSLGALAFVAFLLVERYSKQPMLPLRIFASRLFSAVNTVTLAVYAALGGVFFLLVLTLQIVAGYSPLLAGLALLPITLIMLALSARMGTIAQRIGPRLPMTIGPLAAAGGLLLMRRIGQDTSYVAEVLPAVVTFGLGLAITVAPLTSTALAAAGQDNSGIASGVNNAIARTAQMLAVAVLPTLVGLSGDDYTQPAVFAGAFDTAMAICAGLLVLGGLLSAVSIPSTALSEPAAPRTATAPEGVSHRTHCPVDGTPLTPSERNAAPAREP